MKRFAPFIGRNGHVTALADEAPPGGPIGPSIHPGLKTPGYSTETPEGVEHEARQM